MADDFVGRIVDYAKDVLGYSKPSTGNEDADLLLRQVEAERAGTPLPGSVAYEKSQQFLPSPSEYDTIQPSAPQGPRDVTSGWASWLASKIQDPNLPASDRAAGERRIAETLQFVPDILGFQSAYNMGSEGARGNYGAAALEGVNTAAGAFPFMSPGIKAVGEAVSAARAASPIERVGERAVDLARRQLFMPSTTSAEGAVLPTVTENADRTLADRIMEAPVTRRQVNTAIAAAPVVAKIGPEVATMATEAAPSVAEVTKATPEVISGHLENILSQPLTADDPILNKYLLPEHTQDMANFIPKIDPEKGMQKWHALIDPDTEMAHDYEHIFDYSPHSQSSMNLDEARAEMERHARDELEKAVGRPVSDEEFSGAMNKFMEKQNQVHNVYNDIQNYGEDRDSDFNDHVYEIVKGLSKESSFNRFPGTKKLMKMVEEKYNPEGLMKYYYKASDEKISEILNTRIDPHGEYESAALGNIDNPHVGTIKDHLGEITEDAHSYGHFDDHELFEGFLDKDNLKDAWKKGVKERTAKSEAPQVESAPRTSDQVLDVKEEPVLSISEQRQAAQERIKALRSQLNTLQEGTPEHSAIKTQIAEEGAKLGQLRGPAQEAVVKEAPPVKIKSRSPTGLYSEAEEIARRLPQADTPENLVKAILNKGVKDAELIDARVMNKDRTPTPEFTEYLASRGSQQPISDAVGDYIATNLPTLQKRVLKGHEAAYIDAPGLKEHPYGGSDYRELLFHYPGSGYDGGHWRTIQPNTAMHARVENTPDSLFVHEMQADQAQQGRQMGFRDQSAATALEKVSDEFNAVKGKLTVAQNEFDQIRQEHLTALNNNQPASELYARLTEAKKDYENIFADYQRLSNEFMNAWNNVAATSPIPLSPHVEDTGAWTRAMAKELLVEAVDNGKGKIEISGGNTQNFRANALETLPEDYTDHSHYYNVIIPSEFKAVLKELDPSADMGKVVRIKRVKPTSTEVENDPTFQNLREKVKDMSEVIQNYPDQREMDALKLFHGDGWEEQADITRDEMYEELAGYQEALMQYFDRRDRVEINLTPKMIEAIKGKKLKKYFQGGRVE